MASNKIIIEIEAQDNASQKIRQTISNINTISSDLSRLNGTLGAVGNAFGVAFSGTAIIGAAKSILTVNEQMNQLRATFQALAQADAGNELEFVRKEANRLGQDVVVLSNAYKGLLAASKGTNLEGETTKRLFAAIAQEGAVLKLSSDQVAGAMLAVQQMMSKGKVTAEELRTQLGERLPDAVQNMAKALGVSTGELDAMLQKGEVGLDVLPKFAKVVGDKYSDGVASAVNTASNATARLKNELRELGDSLAQGSGLSQGFTWLVNQLTTVAHSLNEYPERFKMFRDEFSRTLNLIDATQAANKPIGQNPARFIPQQDIELQRAKQAAGDYEALKKNQKEYWDQWTDSAKEAGRAIETANSPLEKLNESMAKYQQWLKDGVINQQAFTKLQSYAQDQYDKTLQKATKIETPQRQMDYTDIDQSLMRFGQSTEDVFQKLNDAKAEYMRDWQASSGDLFESERTQIQKWADDAKIAFSQRVESAQQAYKEIQQKLARSPYGATPEAYAETAKAKADYEALKNVASEYYDIIDKTAQLKEDDRWRDIASQEAESVANLNLQYAELTGTLQEQYALQVLLLKAQKDRESIGKSESEKTALSKIFGEQIRMAELKGTGSYYQGFLEGADELRRTLPTAFDGGMQAANAFKDALQDVSDAFVDMAFEGKASFSDLVTSMIKDMARLAMQQTTNSAISSIFGLFTGVFSGGVGYDAALGKTGYGIVPFHHSGGVVGDPSTPSKPVNMAIFANAKRYHSGLASDEFPAILQRGETVIPRGGSAGGITINAPVNVNVQSGASGAQSDISQGQQIGEQVAKAMRSEIIRTIQEQMRPGNTLNRGIRG